ncbi:MarR family transcriptional regulator [Variovorax sp. Sphag1AA]|uniref:MarR family winged helix-turn-helix transcriptional regulator n=1 Tax=Variovorax sp. Sphag1AA TaxID=2587027 RepID=UPI001834AD3F|nr:MarR family transcriptional regulator [Variovorax sp. Sphag1AA]MBB3177817.1 DNA-binding MarR family transcriptional regulator [Variovorax sp. Sphag1AA]
MSARDGSSPWIDLDADGDGLSVDTFITTLMSQVGSALRRTITVPYVQQFGLTVSEWRLLSLIAHHCRISFADLVMQSESDKALVSRTVKVLQSRGLVRVEGEGDTPRRKVWCAITPSGQALYQDAIPIARERQATAIRSLSQEERDVMYRALRRLRAHCLQSEAQPSIRSARD